MFVSDYKQSDGNADDTILFTVGQFSKHLVNFMYLMYYADGNVRTLKHAENFKLNLISFIKMFLFGHSVFQIFPGDQLWFGKIEFLSMCGGVFCKVWIKFVESEKSETMSTIQRKNTNISSIDCVLVWMRLLIVDEALSNQGKNENITTELEKSDQSNNCFFVSRSSPKLTVIKINSMQKKTAIGWSNTSSWPSQHTVLFSNYAHTCTHWILFLRIVVSKWR